MTWPVLRLPPATQRKPASGQWLRPSGVTEFDGRRVDTLSEGPLIEAGQWVRCVDVRAGKVIVRPADKPDLGGLETAVFR